MPCSRLAQAWERPAPSAQSGTNSRDRTRSGAPPDRAEVGTQPELHHPPSPPWPLWSSLHSFSREQDVHVPSTRAVISGPASDERLASPRLAGYCLWPCPRLSRAPAGPPPLLSRPLSWSLLILSLCVCCLSVTKKEEAHKEEEQEGKKKKGRRKRRRRKKKRRRRKKRGGKESHIYYDRSQNPNQLFLMLSSPWAAHPLSPLSGSPRGSWPRSTAQNLTGILLPEFLGSDPPPSPLICPCRRFRASCLAP